MEYRFDHENLDVYRLALEVAREIAGWQAPRGWASLYDQAVRASASVVLNIAEGRARGGPAGRNHYRIAHGSAAETCSALDLLPITNAVELQKKERRVGAMLSKMSRI